MGAWGCVWGSRGARIGLEGPEAAHRALAKTTYENQSVSPILLAIYPQEMLPPTTPTLTGLPWSRSLTTRRRRWLAPRCTSDFAACGECHRRQSGERRAGSAEAGDRARGDVRAECTSSSWGPAHGGSGVRRCGGIAGSVVACSEQRRAPCAAAAGPTRQPLRQPAHLDRRQLIGVAEDRSQQVGQGTAVDDKGVQPCQAVGPRGSCPCSSCARSICCVGSGARGARQQQQQPQDLRQRH